MDWNQDIANKLVVAWEALLVEQSHLFQDNVDEPTVSGAYAKFLETLRKDKLLINVEFPSMNDLHGNRIKKEIQLGPYRDEVKPDIIVHKPKEDSIDSNLLAIELKKWNNSNWRHDEDKLLEMTSRPRPPRRFQYRFGLLLRFRRSGEIGEATLFQGGKSIHLNPKTLRQE